MRTQSDESIEELTALAERHEPTPIPAVRSDLEGDLYALFTRWADAHGLIPGSAPSLRAQDFYRHFAAWCGQEGFPVPAVTPQAFGRLLGFGGHKNAGLAKHCRRLVSHAHHGVIIWYVPSGPATAFREWLRAHPPSTEEKHAFEKALRAQGNTKTGADISRLRKEKKDLDMRRTEKMRTVAAERLAQQRAGRGGGPQSGA